MDRWSLLPLPFLGSLLRAWDCAREQFDDDDFCMFYQALISLLKPTLYYPRVGNALPHPMRFHFGSLRFSLRYQCYRLKDKRSENQLWPGHRALRCIIGIALGSHSLIFKASGRSNHFLNANIRARPSITFRCTSTLTNTVTRSSCVVVLFKITTWSIRTRYQFETQPSTIRREEN